MNPNEPTPEQIQNSAFFGWQYIGEKMFYNEKRDLLGFFSSDGFKVE